MNEEHLEFVHKRLRISREIQLISTVIHIGQISSNIGLFEKKNYRVLLTRPDTFHIYKPFLLKFISGTSSEHQRRKSDNVLKERFEIHFANLTICKQLLEQCIREQHGNQIDKSSLFSGIGGAMGLVLGLR